jgi:hypothetical protein
MNGQPPQWTPPQGVPVQPPPHKSFPVGLILILILAGFGALGDLTSLTNPVLVLGTTVITGPVAVLWYLVELGVMITLFVAILKRQELGRLLGIGVSGYKIAFSTLAFLVYLTNPEGMQDVMEEVAPGYADMVPAAFMQIFMGVSAVMSWVIGTAVIVYLVVRKSYFTNSSAGSVAPPAGPIQ